MKDKIYTYIMHIENEERYIIYNNRAEKKVKNCILLKS